MASFRAEVAFPAEIVGTNRNVHWMLEPDARGGMSRVVAKNRIANGEIMAENPSGLPKRHKFHKGAVADEDWFMRYNDRTKTATNADYRYCPENPFEKKGFGYNAMPKHHSRRVFVKLARQGHSFSEGNIIALKEDPALRKAMNQRYKELWNNRRPKQPEPPLPAQERPAPPPLLLEKSGSRCGSGSAMALGSLRSSCKPPSEKITQHADPDPNSLSIQEEPLGSRLSACWPAAAGSSLSAQRPEAPKSTVSAQRPQAPKSALSALDPSESPVPGSSLPAIPPASELAASRVSIGNASGLKGSRCASSLREPDQLSAVSDFYSWRPSLIR
eukprot:gnl/MRDRNA2_/MRDRNA2_105031_c0_seq1.p1 gnl/MRDRNA2_/MRDRNA2_105031_c0~~gnl/MRDRNA2_/MRDRNA2_105031_c0_seq1.p1  ORF type:complete len:330 (+),score=53.91 gnl/MRDRNA2_/MRDRNA2_105031_c0_seq1:73-1062(+)